MKLKHAATKPEILAPAGDLISLQAALDAGCDAVYVGVRGMNMRAGAENFTPAALAGIARACHKKCARAYLALNTIVYENERTKVAALIGKAKNAGMDAVICWDLAVVQEALLQRLPVHLSTQMSVANSSALLFFYKTFGIRRFVLARECSLRDIRTIRKNLAAALGPAAEEIELEVFAHGAMCVSISGRCFLSQFQYGKSANRGACLQPCRREYLVTDLDEKHQLVLGSNYILSPRDLCTLPFIEKLIGAGIASLKIEGRNRSPEYVGTVTAAYRQAVDFYIENRGRRGFRKQFADLRHELTVSLCRVYNRGFSSGFYLGRPANQWTDTPGSRAPVRKEYVGVVTNYYKKPGVTEIRVESNEFRRGDELMFQGTKTGVFSQAAREIEIDHRSITSAGKGCLVAVKTDRQTRRNDRVYILKQKRT